LTNPAPKNVPASVRQKLLDLARKRDADFGLPGIGCHGISRPWEGLELPGNPKLFALK
jgi:hypothetical protein